MTSSMALQGGLKVGPLYSFRNEITTFFMITKKRAKISSLNFLCIGIMSLWLQLYRYIFMTSLMTSPGNKIGQMAIFLVYSTSGITSVKKFVASSKWRPFRKFWNIKHNFNLISDMIRLSQIMPKKVFFYGDDVIDDVTGCPQSFTLCLGEVDSGSKLQGQCLVNKCQYHNCLSRLYMPKNDLNE